MVITCLRLRLHWKNQNFSDDSYAYIFTRSIYQLSQVQLLEPKEGTEN